MGARILVQVARREHLRGRLSSPAAPPPRAGGPPAPPPPYEPRVTRTAPRRAARPRLAPLVAAAALLAGCLHDVHRVEPVLPAPPPWQPDVRILVFGDFGHGTLLQRLVARGMRRATEAEPFDLAVQVGDNVYFCGPDPARPGAETCRFEADGATVAPGAVPPDDPLFRVNEGPLEGLRARGGGPLPTYLALGNHDIGWGGGRCVVPGLEPDEAARRRACLSVARRTPTWTMPARHYVVDRGPLRLVVVDTNVVVADYGGFTLDDELTFLREATRPCGAERVCFVVGHHPPAAVHGYGGARARGRSPYAERMARLVGAAGGRAQAFFAGHVHTLEHLSLDGLDVFISGSTAMGGFMPFRVRVPARAQLRFATNAWGWAVLEVGAGRWSVAFHDYTGDPLHCCEASDGETCRPVECRG
jgi:3',5'-cyclic AMP phosphodiesterase CpdA